MRATRQVHQRRGGGGGRGGGALFVTEEKKDDTTTTLLPKYNTSHKTGGVGSRSAAQRTVGQPYHQHQRRRRRSRMSGTRDNHTRWGGTMLPASILVGGKIRHSTLSALLMGLMLLMVLLLLWLISLVFWQSSGPTDNAVSRIWGWNKEPVVPLVGTILFTTNNGLGSIQPPVTRRKHDDDGDDGGEEMEEDSSDDEGPFYNHFDHHTDFDEAVSHRSILWDRDDPYLAKYAPDEDLEFYQGFPHYYAFDDDYNNSPVWEWEDGDTQGPLRPCRKHAHHRSQHLTCNHFHEVDLPLQTAQDEIRFIGSGAYRDVFTFTPGIVLKVAEINLDYNPEAFESMRMEGAVYSLLSQHPLIVNTYGNCALSIFNEAMTHGDMEKKAAPHYNREICENMPPLDGPELLANMTNFSPTEKLEYALDMAEALALLHNHKDGMIIHDDVHLAQFMLTNDGGLKLGDFNRAEFPKYDELHGKYCKYRNGRGHGDWRSPEEYFDRPLDEKIDVWSLGNNFYTLLTGVFPFPELCTSKEVRGRIKFSRTAWVDPRWIQNSYAERALIKAMGSCYAHQPEDRPTMGKLVQQLRKAVAENKRLNSQK